MTATAQSETPAWQAGAKDNQQSGVAYPIQSHVVKRFCPYLASNLMEGEAAHVTCTLHGGAVFDLALCIRHGVQHEQ
jgi:hypothetical protein